MWALDRIEFSLNTLFHRQQKACSDHIPAPFFGGTNIRSFIKQIYNWPIIFRYSCWKRTVSTYIIILLLNHKTYLGLQWSSLVTSLTTASSVFNQLRKLWRFHTYNYWIGYLIKQAKINQTRVISAEHNQILRIRGWCTDISYPNFVSHHSHKMWEIFQFIFSGLCWEGSMSTSTVPSCISYTIRILLSPTTTIFRQSEFHYFRKISRIILQFSGDERSYCHSWMQLLLYALRFLYLQKLNNFSS